MAQRIDYMAQAPELFKKYVEIGQLIAKGSIDKTLRGLVDIRASQINGCGFCLG